MKLGDLCDVHGNGGRTEADRHAEYEATGNEQCGRIRKAHRERADREDDAGD